jgi:hypothetical protein
VNQTICLRTYKIHSFLRNESLSPIEKFLLDIDDLVEDASNMSLNPRQVVAFFREKAIEFNRIADTVEATFGVIEQSANGAYSPRRTLLSDVPPSPLTVEAVHELLEKRSMRTKDIADHFKVSREEVAVFLLQHAHLFTVGDRGWVTVFGQTSNQPQSSGATER